MTKLRYCISSMGIAWLGSDFASCLEQHELYLRLAGKDSEWIFCSNQWQECQCNNHVRLLACMILYVDFIIPMDSWTFCSNEIVLRPPFKIQMLRWGTAKRWKLISPKKVGALFSVKFLGQNPLKQFWRQWEDVKKSVSCQLIAARKHKDLPDLLGKGTRICCPRCDVNYLGDPVPGEDGKHCQCLVSHGRLLTEFEATCDFYLVFRIVS